MDVGPTKYAIEHTEIESFPRQNYFDAQTEEFIGPIKVALDGDVLPKPGFYVLVLPVNPQDGFKKGQLAQAQEALVAWIKSAAQELWERNPRRLSRDERPFGSDDSIQTTLPGYSYPVKLERRLTWAESGRHDGFLSYIRIAPGNVQEQRIIRLGTGLDKKCKKLRESKEAGATAVLVLENRDIALANHVAIGDALCELAERAACADAIFLVETSFDTWLVWEWDPATNFWFEGERADYKATELNNVTT